MTSAFRAGWHAGRAPKEPPMRWWEHLIPNRSVLHRIDGKITTLGADMALNADELKQRINDATDNIGADIRRVKNQLAQALTDADVVADARVQEALGGFDTIADRLENLAAETPEDELDAPADPETGEQA